MRALFVLGICAGLVLAVASAFVPASVSWAADRNGDRLFSVHGIAVDITANNATEARRRALADAQSRAWQLLIDKLVAPDNADLLPPASPPLLERLVRAVDVRDERSSARRYLATIDVTFWADGVRDLFAQSGVSYTESSAGPYLLLPLLVEGGARSVFGAHIWRQALDKADLDNRLISYRFPDNSVMARRWLNPVALDDATPQSLEPVARAFSVAKAVVAMAQPGVDFASGRPALDYKVIIGPRLDDEAESLAVRSGHLVARPEESQQDLLLRAANMVLKEADTAWKARTLVAGSDRHLMTVLAPVRGLEDWVAIRDRLATVAIVRDVTIGAINIPLSHFTLEYVGTLDQLRLALSQARLSLEEGGDGPVLRPVEQMKGDKGA